jgi:hypothetical protein
MFSFDPERGIVLVDAPGDGPGSRMVLRSGRGAAQAASVTSM